MGDMATDRVQKKSRRGCLPSIALMLAGGLILVMLLHLALAPWIYVAGGHTRLLPVWAGVGEVDTSSGRYRLHIWFSLYPDVLRKPPTGSHMV